MTLEEFKKSFSFKYAVVDYPLFSIVIVYFIDPQRAKTYSLKYELSRSQFEDLVYTNSLIPWDSERIVNDFLRNGLDMFIRNVIPIENWYPMDPKTDISFVERI
jgi:hypothetical protein